MPKVFLTAPRAGGNLAQLRLRLARKKVVGCQLSPRPELAEGFFDSTTGGWGLLHARASRRCRNPAENGCRAEKAPWNQAIAGCASTRNNRVAFDTDVWHYNNTA
jgi:hypothetical protein